jgi:hypothetical protein
MHPEELPNLDRSLDSLEARLRALPPPPVPAGLEARLLAATPARLPTPRRRWGARAIAVAGLAAAGLLAILAWPGRDGNNVIIGPPTSQTAAKVSPRPTEEPNSMAALLKAQRDLDEADPPSFTWPLPPTPPLTLSTATPADLLD